MPIKKQKGGNVHGICTCTKRSDKNKNKSSNESDKKTAYLFFTGCSSRNTILSCYQKQDRHQCFGYLNGNDHAAIFLYGDV